MKETKDIILDKALDLFSTHGYDGVTVEDIAQKVGIKAPSLYKHYKSKSEIFDFIIEKGKKRYIDYVSIMEIDGLEAEKDQDYYKDIESDDLVKIGIELFQYFLHDDYLSKIRKMLNIEQYKNEDISSLYIKQYIKDPLDYQTSLFSYLAKGRLKDLDPQTMALHFYAPIYLMLILCDSDPKKEDYAIKLIEKHILQFSQIYEK